MLGPEYEMAPVGCPYCDFVSNAGRPINGVRAPQPGDISVCFACAQPLRLDDALKLRKLTPEDEAAIDAQPGLRAELEAMSAAIRETDRRDLQARSKAGSS